MLRNWKWAWIAMVFVVACTHQLDAQTIVLDQACGTEGAGQGTARITEVVPLGQTFTVGVSGKLSKIEVGIRPSTVDLLLEVRETTDGLPNGIVLASASLSPDSTVTGWYTFDISSANVSVEVGQVLAILLFNEPGGEHDWTSSIITGFPDPYLDGNFLRRSKDTGLWEVWWDGGFDRDFRTYVELPNEPPVADAGLDQTVECTGALTTVFLDGSESYDPDGDEVGFEWSLPEGSGATIDDPASPTPAGQFPLGPTLVTLTVTDGNGGVACDDVLITVVDTVPPVLVGTTDKIALWPPNHEMRDVLVSVEITDCAWDTGTAITAWVSSSEPDDGTGDGSYTGDVDGQDGFAVAVPVDLIYTGEPEPGVYLYQGIVSLRAERDGSESSRVYSIVCDIEDLGGNTSTASCVVVVPHDRRKK